MGGVTAVGNRYANIAYYSVMNALELPAHDTSVTSSRLEPLNQATAAAQLTAMASARFADLRGRALALVNALDTSGEYDYVLATYTEKPPKFIVRPPNALIPPKVLQGLDETTRDFGGSSCTLLFWAKRHRLRFLGGFQPALAYARSVVQGGADEDLGYPSNDALILALIEVASGIDDKGQDDVGISSMAPTTTATMTAKGIKTHEPELPGATMLQFLLDVNNIDLIDEYLRHSCQNHDHPKMHHIGPKLHACLTTYGWSALGSAVQAMVQRWVATSPPEILHLPFVLLASLAGVLDDPICAPLDHPRLPEVIQAAYVALRSACDAAKALDFDVLSRGRRCKPIAMDAALHMVKCSLLIEALLRDAVVVSSSWALDKSLPPVLISMVHSYWAPVGIMAAMTGDARSKNFQNHALLPAIGLAMELNPRVDYAPYVLKPFDHPESDGSSDASLSIAAATGSLFYFATARKDKLETFYDFFIELGFHENDHMLWLVRAICNVSKRLTMRSKHVTDLAKLAAKAMRSVTLAPGELDNVVRSYGGDAVPLDDELRHEYTCRCSISDALGFFNDVAPFHVGLLINKLQKYLRGSHVAPLRAASVIVPLLQDFGSRWPILALSVRNDIAEALRVHLADTAALVVRKFKDWSIEINGTTNCACHACTKMHAFLRSQTQRKLEMDQENTTPCEHWTTTLAQLEGTNRVRRKEYGIAKVTGPEHVKDAYLLRICIQQREDRQRVSELLAMVVAVIGSAKDGQHETKRLCVA
ncbi:hypothetical protein SDRG_04677 [Saprolegnia diclina VS20]|uniref:Uncharacterized protein n=1 Tax=Saprolegnia diclina (strain VS20) TaxID=1156394 RepID=T0QU59_SAPDV|nr:hypothetical protein SDRG_04677 [Saprolegnia diclina VS20]EQC38251.1 hypothetical protein SDRG_04677 [Saprolegnia diclina VS20]|eukprot:XP_008608578.1 hypothetical protein SDRG_04677 [Saprolegnia diclina VS20]